jgi:PKD repeat protein
MLTNPTPHITKYTSADYIELIAKVLSHGSDHVTGGSQPIPDATVSSSGLMSNTDKIALDALVAAGPGDGGTTVIGSSPLILSPKNALEPGTNAAVLNKLNDELTNTFPIPYAIYQAGSNRTVEALYWEEAVATGVGAGNFTARIEAMVATSETHDSLWLLYAVRVPSGGSYDVTIPLVATITLSYVTAFKKYLSTVSSVFAITGTGDTILFKLVRGSAAGDTLTIPALLTNIIVTPGISQAPVADFTADVVSILTGDPVQFTDLSTNSPTTWVWQLNNGPGDSSMWNYNQNPLMVDYMASGTFWVTLTVTNAYGSDSITKLAYITVADQPNPEPEVFGAPTTVNGYYIGGSYPQIVGGTGYGGGSQYPAYTAGVVGGGYTGGTISTRTALLAALAAATSGAVIYIDPAVNIALDNSADENILVAAGVTIASNRGVSGSAGGMISTTKVGSGWNKPLFRTNGDGVRFTGLRMQGECYAEDYSGTESNFRVGLWIDGHANCVVDNCDFRGFAYANILTWGCPQSGRPWVHHNYIHHSHNQHEGYGVNIEGGDCLVEGNLFYHNRHHITGGGKAGEYYTARYNVMTDNTMATIGRQAMDVHERADSVYNSGERYDIYNNTVTSGTAGAFHCTSEPVGEGHFIHHNIFQVDPTQAGYTLPIIFTYGTGKPHTKLSALNNKWALPGSTPVLYEDETGIVQYQEVSF